jgi:hypothetical protein
VFHFSLLNPTPKMSLSTAWIPTLILFVLVLAAACLSNLGAALYFSEKSTSRVHSDGISSGNGTDTLHNHTNNAISTIITTTATPTWYPPTTEQQAQQPVAKRYDDFWLVASPQRQVAVTIIPKVMCTSIRSAMNAIECQGRDRCAEARWSAILHQRVRKNLLTNFTNVVFYRDPIERALSTYYNSESNRYILVQGCDTWKNCTFDYWVENLAPYQFVTSRKVQGQSMNEHFLKQTVVSQRQKMHYHYRLRMTNKDHIDFFFEQLLETAPQSKNQSSNSKQGDNSTTTKSMEDIKAYVSKKFEQVSMDALARLLVIYQDDFDLWEDMVASAPKGPNEYTMYDYYKEYLAEELRPKVERLKKEMATRGTR